MQKEDKLVRKISRSLGGKRGNSRKSGLCLGIGDDSALYSPSPGYESVVSCDAFLEDIHFRLSTDPPDSVGYKSLVRATSDLVAMGAEPQFFLLTLALPPRLSGQWLDSFLKGMSRASRRLKIAVLGGDTTANSKVFISLTVIGQIRSGHERLRSNAKPGDLIYVSGRLGGAALGFALLGKKIGLDKSIQPLLRPHFYPRIRPALGAWLARTKIASAMMDLSDGLSSDLTRMCRASGVGARVSRDRLPRIQLSARQSHRLANMKLDFVNLALHGGDDYELLFTIPRKLESRLRRAPHLREVACIGEITRDKKIVLVDAEGISSRLEPQGWDSFRAQ